MYLENEMTDLTTIPGSEDDLRGAIEQMKRSLPLMAEVAPEIAALRWKLYNAHIEAGFTPAQALELSKSITL